MNTENRLLQELLNDDELSALRQASLARGLRALHQRRRRRRQLQVAAVLIPLLVLLGHWPFRQAPRPAALASVTTPSPRVETEKVQYITKDQLLALFPNRPIALIGPPGHQQFILLDELPRIEAQ
ncbi:MAG: hypothetical protein ACLQVY_18600 [Limisphaerales bacterium]